MSQNFIYFPNPTNSHITIQCDQQCIIYLYSADGKLIYQNEIQDGLGAIDVSSFAKGIYTIVFQTPVQKGSARLIIN